MRDSATLASLAVMASKVSPACSRGIVQGQDAEGGDGGKRSVVVEMNRGNGEGSAHGGEESAHSITKQPTGKGFLNTADALHAGSVYGMLIGVRRTRSTGTEKPWLGNACLDRRTIRGAMVARR